ncbi:hypothetical protein Tco_0581427, partial [Tanacetum coccineum]
SQRNHPLDTTGGRTERKRGRCCERDDIIYKSSAERPKKLLALLSGETTEATVCLFLREKVTRRKSRGSFPYEKQTVRLQGCSFFQLDSDTVRLVKSDSVRLDEQI